MTAAVKRLRGSPTEHRKNIVKLLQANSRRRHLWEVFSDFVELAALAVANSTDLAQFDEREQRYGVLQGSCRVSRVFKLLFSVPVAPSLG